MIIFSDSKQFAEMVMLDDLQWRDADFRSVDGRLAEISDFVFDWQAVHQAEITSSHCFDYLFVSEHSSSSQYDFIIDLCKQNAELPHGILLLAGSGSGFHGQRDRAWESPPGNIYLTAFFAPNREIHQFGPGFMALSAVSVVDAIDSIDGLRGRSSLKWVNDILVGNAKVGGVLTYTQAMGPEVTGAVLGIGVNVESPPEVELNEFVPDVACLSDYVDDINLCNLRLVLDSLIHNLDRNYQLLDNGDYRQLLDQYRNRSAVIGRDVVICADDDKPLPDIIATGRVKSIGENLELYLEGFDAPISRGRLILRV